METDGKPVGAAAAVDHTWYEIAGAEQRLR